MSIISGLESFMENDPTYPTKIDISRPAQPIGPVVTPNVLTVKNITNNYVDPTQNVVQETCPVYVDKNAKGGYRFSAYITGSISDVDDYLDLIDILFSANTNDEVFIYLDSPGGQISAGGIIASAIDGCAAEVYAVVRGLCASAAALIMTAVKKENIQVSPFAVIMFHMSSHMDMGFSTKILERSENQIKYVNDCLLKKAYDEKLITEEEFNKIQNGEEIFVSASEFKNKLGA